MTTELRITGMDCADCAATLEKAVGRMDGVQSCAVSFTTGKMNLDGSLDLDAIQAGLAFFVRLGEVAHAAEVAARMRPPGDDAFVNPLFVRCLEDLTGERLGPEPAAWRQWAARRRAGPPTPEGPR